MADNITQGEAFISSAYTLDEAISELIQMGCPVEFDTVRDFDGQIDHYIARWTVDTKAAERFAHLAALEQKARATPVDQFVSLKSLDQEDIDAFLFGDDQGDQS